MIRHPLQDTQDRYEAGEFIGEYSVSAIPTVYRGRRYRSRLEARWAAYFDLLGWQHEYEPFDLGTWSPDFLLRGDGFPGEGALVEVKPLSDEPDPSMVEKVYRATAKCRREEQVIILGVAPWLGHGGVPTIGWQVWHWRLLPARLDFEEAQLAVFSTREGPRYDFRSDERGCLTSLQDIYPCPEDDWPSNWNFVATDLLGIPSVRGRWSAHLMSLWGQATNAVQWRPTGRTQP